MWICPIVKRLVHCLNIEPSSGQLPIILLSGDIYSGHANPEFLKVGYHEIDWFSNGCDFAVAVVDICLDFNWLNFWISDTIQNPTICKPLVDHSKSSAYDT